MRSLSIIFLLLFACHPLKSQETIAGFETNCVFGSLKDLLDREPTHELPDDLCELKTRNRGRINGMRAVAFRIKGSKKHKLPKGRAIAILMNGDLYINPDRPRLNKRADFYKVDWIGSYGYFINSEEYPVWCGDSFDIETFLVESLIDPSNREIITLNKKSLRRILQDEPALLQEFEQQTRKKKKLRTYLTRHQQIRSR